jgi:hypothetical protein
LFVIQAGYRRSHTCGCFLNFQDAGLALAVVKWRFEFEFADGVTQIHFASGLYLVRVQLILARLFYKLIFGRHNYG